MKEVSIQQGRTVLEQSHRASMVDAATNRAIAAVFQRDEKVLGGRKNAQSLETYDRHGDTQNPADAEHFAGFQNRVHARIEQASAALSVPETEQLLRIMPSIAGALILDERYIDKVYTPDLPDVIGMAVDIFEQPDSVEQMEFRIGFGGEQEVSSRAPAYLESAIESAKRLKKIFDQQANYARLNGLHARLETTHALAVNEWVATELGKISEQKEDHASAKLVKNTNLNISVPSNTTEAEIAGVLDRAWQVMLGVPPDIEELKQRYHFTDKLPKIVVFNAAHAAIEINRMDPEAVLTARDQTQALLRGYITKFHPEVADCLEFQNDQPWEMHDYYTHMLIRYTHDIMRRENGKKKSTDETLARFEKHHKIDGENDQPRSLYNDIPGEQLYADLHPQFFADEQLTEGWSEQLPESRVMEERQRPRYRIYHQGPPEVIFGVYRKAFSEKATLSGFITWLKERHIAATSDMGAIAQTVLETAQTSQQQYTEAGKIDPDTKRAYPFKTHIGKAIKALPIEITKRQRLMLTDYMTSAAFAAEEDQQLAWKIYVRELIASKPTEPVDDITRLREEMEARQSELSQLKSQVSTATLTGDVAMLTELATHPDAALVTYPTRKAEVQVQVGSRPVYFVDPNADSVVYPELELPTYEKYAANIEKQEEKAKRLKSTTTFVNKALIAQFDDVTAPWQVFGAGIGEYVKGAVDHKTIAQWIAVDTDRLTKLYLALDDMEVAGEGFEITQQHMQTLFSEYAEDRVTAIANASGLDIRQAAVFVTNELIPKITHQATKAVLERTAAAVYLANKVADDYALLLRGIDGYPAVAEAKYQALLSELFDTEESSTADEVPIYQQQK